ncbi:hypothetical protein BRADI_3g52107v3 [Brachypodium distachyon]|uniref:Uncharacterized protein n=1 Tax=Brachypodium distachyon TaxID=15368 RepID=A0A2K2D4R6_BRADI|nr:hypothetical protein BRADI_3g52107v3 [Brachypodium distachyon]
MILMLKNCSSNFLSQLVKLKQLDLTNSAFALLYSCGSSSSDGLYEATLTVPGRYEERLKENDEPFGFIPLEAIATQEPVIYLLKQWGSCRDKYKWKPSTANLGARDFLCQPSSIELSKEISRLVNDHDLVVRMGKKARNHVVHGFLNCYIPKVYHQGIK